MPLRPAITSIDELTGRPAVARLRAANPDALTGARFDRDELTLWLDRSFIREACALLKDDPGYSFLSDITAVDWYASEPRFEVVYGLLSIPRKERLRLKVKLSGDDPRIDSLTPIWPAANLFEREIFDLFGIRFDGHPYLRRIMMPDDWEGYPLRKDYPVEGFR
jgi:NADH-quinone oxidoreductase subunit C